MMSLWDSLRRLAAGLRFLQPVLDRVWFVHPPAVLVIRATPGMCLQTLAFAATPSIERLHLRNLFASGRRYQLHRRGSGFTLTTTSQVIWRYRKRTSASAVLLAEVAAIDEQITRIQMRVRISLIYLLDALLIPAFMLSILVFVPWPTLVTGGLLAALFGFSWFGHRYGARLEANEMVFFVQKALEDFLPVEVLSLDSNTPTVVHLNREFGQMWEQFYQAHKDR